MQYESDLINYEHVISSYIGTATEPNAFERVRLGNNGNIHLDGYYAAAQELGIQVNEIKPDYIDFIFSGEKIGHVYNMLPSIVSSNAMAVCQDKSRTFDKVKDAVPTPYRCVFKENEQFEGLEYSTKQDFNVVVKPFSGNGGRGITTHIRNEYEFRKAWKVAVDSLSMNAGKKVIVEEFVPGIDLRVLVVGGISVCATTRLPPYGHLY